MPPRRTRIQDRDSDENDSGYSDSERMPRQPPRRRLSEAHVFIDDSDRTPHKPVNINDDASERRRRRKSTKIAGLDASSAGLSSELIDPDASIGPNTSRSGALPRLNSIPLVAPEIQLPKDRNVMTSNFEEWMKMATDNKINATNSWNITLIDYFHDMSLLRNTDDNTINFQRASCTLDGCVKIWTSRVDSVGTETGKLLSNLANDPGEGDRDSDAEASDNPEGADPSQGGKKKRSHRAGTTLAKDPMQLRSKKLDLDFSVDPLFKKTCADFDEGGAQGLLMNHLSLGFGQESSMRVIFDASDSTGKVEEEDEYEEVEDLVDISFLRSSFLPDLTVLEDKEIAPSLTDFSFSASAVDDTTFHVPDPATFDDDDEDFGGPADGGDDMNIDQPRPEEQDFFSGDQAINDDFIPEFGNGSNDGDADEEQAGRTTNNGAFVPFDPRQAQGERDLIMAMTEDDIDGGMLEFFDRTLMQKNWAGPEHWKLRRPIRRLDGAETDKPKRQREKKEAFKIDFLTPPAQDLKTRTKELFAKPTRGAGINLPKSKKAKKEDHRLPDDMHFNSRQLVTLFLKPKFSLKMRGRQVKYNENGDGEVDQNFWAQAAADQAAGRTAPEDEDGTVPFNTQFFHDDDDDDGGVGAFDDYGASIPVAQFLDDGEQDLLASTQRQSRRVKPEAVKYTKRAKRVNVRRLKENIWKGLSMANGKPPKNADVDMDGEDTDEEEEPKVFGSVITDLSKAYPPDKMEEISTSFCFICLLHLANEEGLKIERDSSGDIAIQTTTRPDGKESVGNLFDLKVSRDLTL